MTKIKHLLFGLLFLPTICLGSCGANLGVFEKEDGYESFYKAFGDVKCLYDGGDHSYDIADSLFNSKTVEKFEWESGDEVEQEEYLYIILPVEEELNIECIVLFFYCETKITLNYSFFYFEKESDTPQNIRYLSSPDPELVPVYDEDGNPVVDEHGEQVYEEDPKYDDPPIESSILTGNISLKEKEWVDSVFGDFSQSGHTDKLLHVKEDSFIYLRIENNSGFNKETLIPIKFNFINLMVRAVEEGEE